MFLPFRIHWYGRAWRGNIVLFGIGSREYNFWLALNAWRGYEHMLWPTCTYVRRQSIYSTYVARWSALFSPNSYKSRTHWIVMTIWGLMQALLKQLHLNSTINGTRTTEKRRDKFSCFLPSAFTMMAVRGRGCFGDFLNGKYHTSLTTKWCCVFENFHL